MESRIKAGVEVKWTIKAWAALIKNEREGRGRAKAASTRSPYIAGAALFMPPMKINIFWITYDVLQTEPERK